MLNTVTPVACLVAALLSACGHGDAVVPPGGAKRVDRYGDPLPDLALARLGTTRFRACGDAAAMSPDAKTIAVAGHDLRLICLQTGKTVRRIPVAAQALGFSNDGRKLVLVEFVRFSIWEVATGKKLKEIAPPNGMVGTEIVAFTPDDKHFVTAGDSQCQVWDSATGDLARKLESSSDLTGVVFAPDSSTLIGRKKSGDIVRIDLGTGTPLKPILGLPVLREEKAQGIGFRRAVISLAKDGETLASISGDENRLVICDIAAGKLLQTIGDDLGPLVGTVFAPDGKEILTLTSDGYLSRWDAKTGKPVGEPLKLSRFDCDWFFTPKQDQCVCYDRMASRVAVWDLKTGKLVNPTGGHQARVGHAAFAGGSQVLACGDGTLRCWDIHTGRELRQIEFEEIGRLGLAFSSNGPIAVAFGTADQVTRKSRREVSVASQSVICWWDLETGEELERIDAPDRSTLAAVFTPCGEYVASAGNLGTLCLWKKGQREPIWKVAAPKYNSVNRLSFSPDGRRILTTGPNRTVGVYDRETGKLLKEWPVASPIVEAQFHPNGRHAIVAPIGDRNSQVHIIDLESGDLLRAFPDTGLPAALSADGKTLFAARGRSVVGFELATGAERFRFNGHDGGVTSLVPAPNGAVLVSGSDDTTLLVWDLSNQPDDAAKTLAETEWASLWAQLLKDDGRAAWEAIGRMMAARQDTIAFLRTNLNPTTAITEAQWQQLLADLDGPEFPIRQRAAESLFQLGDAALPRLRDRLQAKPTEDLKQRLIDLIKHIDSGLVSGERLRHLRAVEVLERIGTAEAQDVLSDLVQGGEGMPLTEDARRALARLKGE